MDAPRRNQFQRYAINEGMQGIWLEVGRMVEYVREFSGDPELVDFSRTLVLGCNPRDIACEIETVHKFVITHFRFVQDPTHKEVISTPVKMMDDIEAKGRTSGDCDEGSCFEAALLAAIGIKPRFRFGGEGREIYHVWLQAQFNNKWVDLEPSGYLEPGKFFKFPRYEERVIFPD